MIKSDMSIGLKKIDFNPFEEGKEIEKIARTTGPQREIWLSCILGEEDANLAYNESVSLALTGTLVPDHFIQAIRSVVSRHEALRATLSSEGDTLIIYKELQVAVPVIDIMDSTDKSAALEAFVTSEMAIPFDLQHGPLFRFFLHILGPDSFHFTLVLHHIIADGWSTGVILTDLSEFYNALLENREPVMEQPFQISEYAKTQEVYEKAPAFLRTKKYWLELYKDNIPALDLPTDSPRPPFRTYKSKRIDHPFAPELVADIKKLGAHAGCSFVNTLLCAYELFLYLRTNHRHHVIGLPAAGQSATGNYNLVGHCVNLLPIRSFVDPNLSFEQYLKTRKRELFDAFDHQRITFGQLIKNLDLKRDNSRIPLVPVIFNVDMGMDTNVFFTGMSFRLISNPRACETFEISINATGSESSFLLEWAYNVSLFKAESIRQAATNFELLLKSLVKNPDTPIRDLNAANSLSWSQQLKKWNNTARPYQQEIRFTALIDQQAAKNGSKTAVSFFTEKLSYQLLKEQSDQFAAFLSDHGVKHGDVVGVATSRSPEMIIALTGILKTGAAYLPLDPEYPKERVEFMLADASVTMVIVSKPYAGKFKSGAAELIIEDIWPVIKTYRSGPAEVPLTRGDLAYILYTSGSTGKPKGVKVSHRSLMNLLTSIQQKPGITPDDRMAAITTISFDIAAVELFLPLITGAEVVLYDRETARDGRLLVEAIEKQGLTIMQATPATWRMMVDAGWSKKFRLKIFCGGEALKKDLAEKLLERAGSLWNMYGPTETTIYSVIKQIDPADETISIGWPINNTQVYIFNDDNELAVRGVVGEILIGGDGVAEGYLNRTELTQEKFIDNPFNDQAGAKLYRTGDLGKYHSRGDIHYYGRIDQQVKVRGYRIELGEIESLLTEQPDIRNAVVLAREDQPGNTRLVAYLLLKQGRPATGEISINDLKQALKQKLPDFMVPSDFVVLKSFPLTPNNKVDRKALPDPQPIAQESVNGRAVAQGQTEEMMVRIWSQVLGKELIGTNEDFFDLGGHSLLAVRVMAAIEKETGKRLPLATLFKNSTIQKLAKRVGSIEEDQWQCLVPIKTTGSKHPVYLVHGGGLNVLLFASISKFMDPEQPVFGVQALGLNRPTPPLGTLVEIASFYLSEIMEANPSGPYALAGYSLGGKIVFEMARQLQALGKEVKFLGIIDTYANNRDASGQPALFARKIIRQFKKIPYFVNSFLKHPAEALDYQIQMTNRRLQGVFKKKTAQDEKLLSPYELEIQHSYDQAYTAYQLEPSALQVDLFRVQKRLYFLDDLVYLGWKKFAKKGVRVHEVPGDHRTFLYPPNDEGFAKVLQRALDQT